MSQVIVGGWSFTHQEKSRNISRYIRRAKCTNERESEALQPGPVSFLVEAEQENQKRDSRKPGKRGVRAGEQSESPQRNQQRSRQSDWIELFVHFCL
jgi:hypothetical protein